MIILCYLDAFSDQQPDPFRYYYFGSDLLPPSTLSSRETNRNLSDKKSKTPTNVSHNNNSNNNFTKNYEKEYIVDTPIPQKKASSLLTTVATSLPSIKEAQSSTATITFGNPNSHYYNHRPNNRFQTSPHGSARSVVEKAYNTNAPAANNPISSWWPQLDAPPSSSSIFNSNMSYQNDFDKYLQPRSKSTYEMYSTFGDSIKQPPDMVVLSSSGGDDSSSAGVYATTSVYSSGGNSSDTKEVVTSSSSTASTLSRPIAPPEYQNHSSVGSELDQYLSWVSLKII